MFEISETFFIYRSEEQQIQELHDYSRETKRPITGVALSSDENILALATGLTQDPQVDLYEITEDDGLSHTKNLIGFTTEVVAIDFSTDGFYMMAQDIRAHTIYFSIENHATVALQDIEFECEWPNEGLKQSALVRPLDKYYEGENKMTTIDKNPLCEILAVGDWLGTVRLFKYGANRMDFIAVHPAHVWKIDDLIFSKDNNWLVTSSDQDKTLLLWRIQNADFGKQQARNFRKRK